MQRPAKREGLKEAHLSAFPTELSEASLAWWGNQVKQLSNEINPLLAQIPREHVSEMPNFAARDDAASPLFAGLSSKTMITRGPADARKFDPDAVRAEMWDVAKRMGDQTTEQMIAHISKVAEEHDMTIDGTGKDFFEVLIEAYEKVEFSFNDDGTHNMSLLVSPSTHEKLKDREMTADQKARLDAIIARKKEEWDESRRRTPLP